MSRLRVGLGFDIHKFKKGRPLLLGGVTVPHSQGLDGHSDADVILHAIIDAILGAAGLADIGTYFPPGDPETRNIASGRMLSKAILEMEKQGYQIVNIDVVLIAEEPKIAPHRAAMRQTIARLAKISDADVQVKGKTHEGLDALGKRQGMAAHAVVLLEKSRPPCHARHP
jgi:2-C-methyl-D-erythritol 2,4-cyclodiphosphate synthase